MKRILFLSSLFLLFLGIFFVFSSLKNNAYALYCAPIQTGTAQQSFSCSTSTDVCPGVCTDCPVAKCQSTPGCQCSGGITQSCKVLPPPGSLTCTSTGTCPTYSNSWDCPTTQCKGCTYYGGSVSCSTTTYNYCNYGTVSQNDIRCGPTCPTPTPTPACQAGTGSTPASCGGNCSGPSCNGGTCQYQTYHCSGGACVCGWTNTPATGCSPTCTGTPTPTPGGGGGGGTPTTPPATPAPTGPATCQQCLDYGAGPVCSTLQNLAGTPCTTDCTACSGGGGGGGGGCTPSYGETIQGSIPPPSGSTVGFNAGLLVTQTSTDNFYLNINNNCGANYHISSIGNTLTNKDYTISNAIYCAGSPVCYVNCPVPSPTPPSQLACPTAINNCTADNSTNCTVKSFNDYNTYGSCIKTDGSQGSNYSSSCTVTGTRPLPHPVVSACSITQTAANCPVNGNNSTIGKMYSANVTSGNYDSSAGSNTRTFGLYVSVVGSPEALNFTCNMQNIAGFNFPVINFSFAPFSADYYCAYANNDYSNPLGCGNAKYSGANQTNPQTLAGTMPATGTYNFKVLGWNNVGGFISTQYVPAPGMATANNVSVDNVAATCSLPTPTPTPTTYSISGNVFVDTNGNQLKDAGESNYSGSITVASSNGGTITYPTNGTFNIAGLAAGTYTVSYTSLPSGYKLTYPLNGPPPSLTVTVGPPSCSVSGSNSATCDGNNNVLNLNFGISNNLLPWIQIIGSDIRTDGGFTSGGSGGGGGGGGGTSTFSNPVPLTAIAACGGAYTSVPGSTSTTPGMIFSGNGTPDFGQGSASVNNWAVGGISYPETFNPIRQGGVIKTSYAYMQSVAKQAGITPVDLAGTDSNGQPYCSGGISNCALSSTLPHGIYVANGNLTLTGGSYTFQSNQSYIILVNGDLNIQTPIHVPVGSTLMFSVSGSIYVDRSVGVADYTSSASNIEGIFSADKNFVVQGGAVCPSTPDLKLNVAGAIIVNAALGGGTFQNQRDLCGGNAYCPVFTVSARPDFILNAPSFVKKSNNIYQEVAP